MSFKASGISGCCEVFRPGYPAKPLKTVTNLKGLVGQTYIDTFVWGLAASSWIEPPPPRTKRLETKPPKA